MHVLPHGPPTLGARPPSPPEHQTPTVNWSVRHVSQIKSLGAPPPGIPVPPERPKPTLLAQSSQATSKVNWSTPLAYHADLGVPGFPDIRYNPGVQQFCTRSYRPSLKPYMADAPTGQ